MVACGVHCLAGRSTRTTHAVVKQLMAQRMSVDGTVALHMAVAWEGDCENELSLAGAKDEAARFDSRRIADSVA